MSGQADSSGGAGRADAPGAAGAPRGNPTLAALLIAGVLAGAAFAWAVSVGDSAGVVALAAEFVWSAALPSAYLIGALGLGLLVVSLRRDGDRPEQFAGQTTGQTTGQTVERVTVAGGVGLAIMLSLSHALGVLGAIGGALGSSTGRAIAWCVVMAGLAGFVRAFFSLHRSRASVPARVQSERAAGIWPLLPWIPAFLAVGVLLVASRSPPGYLWGSEFGGFDALSYHLHLPKEWIAQERISVFEHNVYSFLPGYAEAAWYHLGVMGGALDARFGFLAMDGLLLTSSQAWHALVTAGAGLATGVLGWSLARDAGADARTRMVAASVSGGLVLATPWSVVVGSLAYNEMAVVLLGSCALVAARSGWLSPAFRGALVAVLVGGACGAKPTAILFIAPTAGLLLLASVPRRSWPPAIGVCLGVGLAMLLPWLVRNAVATGNPVFPSGIGVFGSGHWSAEQAARWASAHHESRPMLERLALAVFADPDDPAGPRHRGMAHAQWGLLWAFTGVGLVVAAATVRTHIRAVLLGAGLLIALAFWLGVTHVQSRFLIPMMPMAAGLVGLAFAALGTTGRLGARTVPVLGVCGLALVGWQTVQTQALFTNEGIQTPDGRNHPNLLGSAYLRAQLVPPGPAPSDVVLPTRDMSPMQYATLGLLPGSRLLLVGSSAALFLGGDYDYATTWDRSVFGEVVAASPGDPASWSATLRGLGYTHVLIDQGELRRLGASGYLDPRLRIADVVAWLRTVEAEAVFGEGRVVILRVPRL